MCYDLSLNSKGNLANARDNHNQRNTSPAVGCIGRVSRHTDTIERYAMKKIITISTLMFCAISTLFLTSCATTRGESKKPTPAQLVAQFCPVVETINAEITTIPGVDLKVINAVNAAKPIVEAVCSQGANITSVDLQSLLKSGLPLLNTVIANAVVASTPAGHALMIALPIAEILIPQILSGMPQEK
jgi:hypothetical protein